MATVFPDIEQIKRFKVSPTPGELSLLTFLNQNLDDSFEIYFQPFLNGDNPDIVLMKKGSGAIIFEVKDWRLSNYSIEDTKWYLCHNEAFIESPLKQVEHYKQNLYDLHIETLLEKKIKNASYFGIVSTAVYFHNESESALRNFLLKDYTEEKYIKYRKFVGFIQLLGNDSLNKDRFDRLLQWTKITQPSPLFTDDLYLSFKRYLQPPFHKLEEGKPIAYTKEQILLIESKAGLKRKIKGVAGSGKTLVLAKRAVNAHKRTTERVLILTYNLSLKNYIHDRISDVKENFFWDQFYVTNYHQFFKAEANNHNVQIRGIASWQDEDFFESVKNKVQKYNAVFIDEVQDYLPEWLEIINKYFITDDAEFVVFGDEKQNIYDRQLDENKEPRIPKNPGAWNRSLNASKRFTSNIANLAMKFQKEFFNKKYTIDEMVILQMPELDYENKVIEYYYFKEDWTPENVYKKMFEVIKKNNLQPSNVGILNSTVEYMRRLDFIIRQKSREKTKTMFETEEVYNHLKEEMDNKNSNKKSEKEIEKMIKEEIDDIRKHKKNHFWMNTGTMKLSTIHSFKGWEIHSLFLIIENEDHREEFSSAELIYTGLTRARINLFVLNLGNHSFDDFFNRHIENHYIQ